MKLVWVDLGAESNTGDLYSKVHRGWASFPLGFSKAHELTLPLRSRLQEAAVGNPAYS